MRTIPPPRRLRAGIYTGTIFEAMLASFDHRRSDRNPRGLACRFGVELLADDGPAAVFDAVDIDRLDKLEAVFASAGIARRDDEIVRALEDLVGKSVEIVVRNVAPRAGRNAGIEKGVISSWIGK